jgi:hypothetical protein
MAREQKIRGFLFYLSVAIFIIGLPFILSFALGYRFDTRTFKFTKAGLIDLKTQPAGANVYLDGRLLNDKTPATINELLPGNYDIRLELEEHYPWLGKVNVEEGKVSRLDKIILFPLRTNIKQLNKQKISSFLFDEKRKRVYYINNEDNVIYGSDLEGDNFKESARFSVIKPPPKEWKVSPDREKILGFNLHQIAIAHLESQSEEPIPAYPIVMDSGNQRILDIFWHSDSYHIIMVTDRNIEVLEAKPDTNPVIIVNLNKKNFSGFYDEAQDVLYFIDSQKAADGKFYDNVYKLDLSTRSYPFKDLMKAKTNE